MSAFIRGEGGWGGDRGPSSSVVVPRTRSRPRRHLRHPARSGPAVPAIGRPQPAPLRSEVRRHGRIRAADPARAVQLRFHGPGPAAHPVRLGSGPVRVDGRPASPSRSSPATSSPCRCGSPATGEALFRTVTPAASSSTGARRGFGARRPAHGRCSPVLFTPGTSQAVYGRDRFAGSRGRPSSRARPWTNPPEPASRSTFLTHLYGPGGETRVPPAARNGGSRYRPRARPTPERDPCTATRPKRRIPLQTSRRGPCQDATRVPPPARKADPATDLASPAGRLAPGPDRRSPR